MIKMNEEKIREELNKVYEGESWDYLTSYILDLQNKLENKQKIIENYKSYLESSLEELNLMQSTRDTYLVCVKTYKQCLDIFNKIEGDKNEK